MTDKTSLGQDVYVVRDAASVVLTTEVAGVVTHTIALDTAMLLAFRRWCRWYVDHERGDDDETPA